MLGNCKHWEWWKIPQNKKHYFFLFGGVGHDGDASYGDGGKHTQRH